MDGTIKASGKSMVLLVSVFGSFVLSVEEPLLVSSLTSIDSFGLYESAVLCMLWGAFAGVGFCCC